MYPDADRKIVPSLCTSGTNNVQRQAILRDRVAQGGGVSTVAKADVAILGGIAGLIPSLIESSRRCKSEWTCRRLGIWDAEEEILLVVLIADAEVGSIVQVDGRCADLDIGTRVT
jgi:hypothetical protein